MAGDPFFNKVSLLLPMTGSNGSTTFSDDSPSPKTATANGNAQISTALEAGGNGYFDGTGDYLSIPDHADFAFGSADFTVEFFINFSTLPGAGLTVGLFGHRTSGSANHSIICWYNETTKWNFAYSTNGTTAIIFTSISLTIPAINTWYHIAHVRKASDFYFFIDGVKQSTNAISGSLYDSTATLIIAALNEPATNFFNGYLKGTRLTKGVARYTADFTPESLPLPTYLEPRANELYAVNQPIVQAFNPTIFNG